MAFLLEFVLFGLTFPLIFIAETRTCKYNEYTVESKSGNLTCLACRNCSAGFGLFPQCGTRIKDNETKNECKACVCGKTYSAHEDISSCEPCGSCADHQTIVKNCTLYSDSQCEDTCSKGYYFEDFTGDCQPCSWCCSDGSNKVRSGCKDMPFYKQCDTNTVKSCKPKCQNDQYVVPGSKGGGYCKNCEVCPPGTAPFPECGSVVENMNNISCRECIKGQTFSDSCGKSPCKPCTRCAIGQKEVLPCNRENDRMCSYCDRGFYSEKNGTKCKRCSVCCNNDQDEHVEQCAKQRMPKKLQCSYIKRRGSVCEHRRIEDRKPFSPVWLAVIVAGGIIFVVGTIVLAVLCWHRRFCCRRVTIVLEESSSLLTSPEQKGNNYCGVLSDGQSNQQETMKSFDDSGVIVHFNDHESLSLERQDVRSEIHWDEVSAMNLLSDDEVQLSPVVQFHPHGSKLSNPVHVRIPHSALVDSNHGWSIGLKSSVLSERAIAWKDETVDGTNYHEVSFYINCLLSYVVVGTPVGNSGPTKKRFYCVVFGGQGKVGQNYSVFLYVIDECDLSLEKIIQDEKSRKRILLSSLHSLHVESVHETDVKVAIKQLSGNWKTESMNPQVISHKSLRKSYQTFPCAEITFAHDNGQNGQFRCTFELTAGDATSQICVRTSIGEDPSGNYEDSGTCQRHQIATGQSTRASKPLLSLVNDHSKLVEDIYECLDTPIQGAGHYEVIGKYFGFTIYTIRSKFEKSYCGPSGAMIEAIATRQPELTVESFAVVVEEQAGRSDVALLLRKYDLDSLKEYV